MSTQVNAGSDDLSQSRRRMMHRMGSGRRTKRETTVKTEEILHMKRSSTWRFIHKLKVLSISDLFYSVDLTALWRRHVVWSHKDGKDLLEIVTGRFATTQIFLSLLFAAEVGTYFSPSRIVTDVRNALRTGPYVGNPLRYATGIVLIVSIILTGSAVLANYTALGVFRCLGHENAAMVLRSDIGLYAAQLPSRLTFLSIITFFAWNVMFWWVNVEGYYKSSLALTILTVLLIGHVITTFSAMGRVIMGTSAMGHEPILPKGTEEKLLPYELTNVLLTETLISQDLQTKVNRQYRHNFDKSKHEDQSTTQPEASYEASLRCRHPDIQLETVHEIILENEE
jgi:hypothetical protein